MSDLVDIREEEAHSRRFVERHSGHKQHWCNENVIRCSCGVAVGHVMSTDGVFVSRPCQVCKEEPVADGHLGELA